MSGIVVTNDPINPGQEPFAHGQVHIELVTGAPGGAGYTATQSIIGRYTTETDAQGNWSATLLPTNSITPANTHYRVTEGFAVSLIIVPDSGGPYTLSSLLVTPPPTPSAPGITGVQVAVGGVVKGVRPEVNFVPGTNVTLAGADNAGGNRVDVTVNASGGSGSGTVTSVNNQDPDGFGNVTLTAAEVGADATGAAAAAQTAAISAAEADAASKYLPLASASSFDTAGSAAAAQSNAIAAAASSAASLYVPLSAEGANGGIATLDGSGHLTAAQGANLVASDWADMLGVALLTARFTESGVTYQQTPGDLVLCLCTASKTKSISSLAAWVTAGGVTASGVNALMLFTESGTLIDQTGDMSAAWASAGMVEGALGGSHVVTAGVNYYLGFLTHFSGTSPHFAATGTAQTANFPLTNGRRTALFKSGQASVPTSFDPSTYTLNSGYFVLYAR